MARTPIRVFAQVKGISSQGAAALAEHFEHDMCEHSGEELEFEYEGVCFFADDFVDMIREHLTPQGQGWVDVIDNIDWTVTRYHVLPDGVSSRFIPIDSVLEQYHQE